MTNTEHIIIKKTFARWAISIIITVIISSISVIKTCAYYYTRGIVYVINDRKDKEAIYRRLVIDSVNISDVQQHIQATDKIVQKHEDYFNYQTNKPMHHFSAFSLVNK